MKVALSTAEAEYISLPTVIRDTIPLMLVTRALRKKFNVDIYSDAVDVYCHCFEDALELAKLSKLGHKPNI